MLKRLEKLKVLNPTLHEHYQQRIEALDPSTLSAHQKLAILEISDSLATCGTTELRTESSLDQQYKRILKTHFRNEAEKNNKENL